MLDLHVDYNLVEGEAETHTHTPCIVAMTSHKHNLLEPSILAELADLSRRKTFIEDDFPINSLFSFYLVANKTKIRMTSCLFLNNRITHCTEM